MYVPIGEERGGRVEGGLREGGEKDEGGGGREKVDI